VSIFEGFFQEIDALWTISSVRQPLHVLGASALMMQVAYERPTNDSDILESHAIAEDVRDALLALAGRVPPLHKRRRMYIEFVPNGLPFLRQQPCWRRNEAISSTLKNFEINVLDVVDVVVSKLARFNANDVSDIEAMIELGHVDHRALLSTFRAAMDFTVGQEDRFPRYITNLNTVERDMLGVGETLIELPSWAG